ncbi:homeobox protein 2-like [Gordionus sp. m RMFG-2023]|uniref:homeobox protein 2-like n=1 Tax=Gordionus sp. m RMFG-2023 TaxID=3053472 RepID=UPI0031FD0991
MGKRLINIAPHTLAWKSAHRNIEKLTDELTKSKENLANTQYRNTNDYKSTFKDYSECYNELLNKYNVYETNISEDLRKIPDNSYGDNHMPQADIYYSKNMLFENNIKTTQMSIDCKEEKQMVKIGSKKATQTSIRFTSTREIITTIEETNKKKSLSNVNKSKATSKSANSTLSNKKLLVLPIGKNSQHKKSTHTISSSSDSRRSSDATHSSNSSTSQSTSSEQDYYSVAPSNKSHQKDKSKFSKNSMENKQREFQQAHKNFARRYGSLYLNDMSSSMRALFRIFYCNYQNNAKSSK